MIHISQRFPEHVTRLLTRQAAIQAAKDAGLEASEFVKAENLEQKDGKKMESVYGR